LTTQARAIIVAVVSAGIERQRVPSGLVGLEPVDRSTSETVSTEVTRTLATYLLDGNLRPGDRIPSERRMAEIFGVGRFVVREAVKTLAVLGMVDVRQGDGTYYRRRADSELLSIVVDWGLLLDGERIEELIEARRFVEVEIAGLAAERHDARVVDDMRGTIAQMKAAGIDADRFVRADIAFHLLIADAAANRTLVQMSSNLRSMLQAWITRVVHGAPQYEPFVSEHIEILGAIEGHDVAAARLAMERHMDSTASRLLARLTPE
jgi:GntR family transcriptional regulator, transcriptional repressor for pyruvate dehydrogenase complex